METLHDLAPVLFAFLACGGFAVIYNIHGPGILICAFGGALGWLSYLLSAPILQSDISQTLVAAIVNGENALFLSSFLHTMGVAGALAVGVLLVSSAVRMWGIFRHRTLLQRR